MNHNLALENPDLCQQQQPLDINSAFGNKKSEIMQDININNKCDDVLSNSSIGLNQEQCF